MNKYKEYTKSEIKEILKANDITPLKFDGQKKEKFAQIKINEKYLPYLISTYGRVLSLNYAHHGLVRFVKPSTKKSGYMEIDLSVDKKHFYMLIHRLVAIAFIKNPHNKPEVNHIDGIKSHNYIWNLEWATSKENIIHGYINNLKTIRRGEEIGDNIYTEKMVRKVCKLLVENKLTFKGISEKTGVSYDMVRHIKNHKSWKHVSSQYDFSHYNKFRKTHKKK